MPWQHIGKTTDVRLTATMVQFFIGGKLVKAHPRKLRGKQTDFADYPPEKIAFHMRTPQWCRKQAKTIGPACEQVIGDLLADNALYRLRSAPGIIALADRHDPGRRRRLRQGDGRGRPVLPDDQGHPGRRHLTRPAAGAAGDGGAAAFLRGPASFANVIPMPGTIPSDAVTPATTRKVTS